MEGNTHIILHYLVMAQKTSMNYLVYGQVNYNKCLLYIVCIMYDEALITLMYKGFLTIRGAKHPGGQRIWVGNSGMTESGDRWTYIKYVTITGNWSHTEIPGLVRVARFKSWWWCGGKGVLMYCGRRVGNVSRPVQALLLCAGYTRLKFPQGKKWICEQITSYK